MRFSMPNEDLELEIEGGIKENASLKDSVLDDDRVYPLILKLSFPMMIGSLIDALYNTVDSIFVGRYVGPEAIAALTINNTIQLTLMAIGATISVGTGVVISRSLGAKQYHRVKEGLISGLSIAFLFSIASAWSLLYNLDNILLFIGSAQSFLSYTREYGSVILWAAFVPVMNGVMSAALRAKGHSNLSMWVLAIGAILNIFLDALFIIYFGWGVRGAALATVFSQIVVSILSFNFIRKKYAIRLRDFIQTPMNLATVGEITLIGLAPGVRQATFSLMNFVANKTLQGYGVEALAAFGIVNRIVNLAFMPIFGCNLGSQPVMAFNYGARRYDRIIAGLKASILISTIIGCVGTVVFLWAPRGLFSLFTDHPATILQSADAMRKMGSLFFIFGMQMMISAFVQSTGFTKLSLFLALSRPLVNTAGFLILPPILGLNGIWFSLPVSDIINSTIALCALSYAAPRLKQRLKEGS